MRRIAFCVALVACAKPNTVPAPNHRLPATPTSVAYGYYWSEAKPALRIRSGDVVEVETMLTNTPAGLERMGVEPADIPPNLPDIVTHDARPPKGPGGTRPTRPI